MTIVKRVQHELTGRRLVWNLLSVKFRLAARNGAID